MFKDCDITIRRLADRLIYIRKVGPFTLCRRIRKFVFVEKEKHQITDGYKFWGLFDYIMHLFFPFFFESPMYMFLRSPYYFMFDSYAKMERPYIPRGMYSDKALPKHLYRYNISTAALRLKCNLTLKLLNRKGKKK